METNEKLNDLKEETENVSKKLHDLTEDELVQVSGGASVAPPCGLAFCNYSNKESCLYFKTVGGHVRGCKYDSVAGIGDKRVPGHPFTKFFT